jgi:tripartite-type tricarboxylate transporter receptor subunit TctC
MDARHKAGHDESMCDPAAIVEQEEVMRLRSVLLAALAISIACVSALAQSSQKPIQIIVPFAPGASADGAARIVANELGPRLGRQVVVEHRAGAGGALGLQMLAKSAQPRRETWRNIQVRREK